MSDALSLATLDAIPRDSAPGYDPRGVSVGAVHLGLGAFARAHVCAYTDAVIARGDDRWGIVGTSQRSAAVPDALQPQDGLYAVLERDRDRPPRARVKGSVRRVACAAEDPLEVVRYVADPAVSVVTLTVTEKGYRSDFATGRLRHDDAEVRADVDGRSPQTVVGQLARGLERRASTDAGPLAVVCCDNLTDNGPRLRQLVGDFVSTIDGGDALQDWIDAQVAFPATMVDRIVPATTEADRHEAARLLGVADAGTVVAEPFSQWVIEDAFTGPRPAWETVGATLTDDVGAYEAVKLRLLNATHSLIAYLGALAGYDTIDRALEDPAIERAARALVEQDQIPTVTPPPALDLGAYRDQVLSRFANPALGHRTTQVAMDGSQKLPQRVLVAVRTRRAGGGEPRLAALLVAAWMRFLLGHNDVGQRLDVSDPVAPSLVPLLESAGPFEATRYALQSIAPDLAEDTTFTQMVSDWFDALSRHGVQEALAAMDT